MDTLFVIVGASYLTASLILRRPNKTDALGSLVAGVAVVAPRSPPTAWSERLLPFNRSPHKRMNRRSVRVAGTAATCRYVLHFVPLICLNGSRILGHVSHREWIMQVKRTVTPATRARATGQGMGTTKWYYTNSRSGVVSRTV